MQLIVIYMDNFAHTFNCYKLHMTLVTACGEGDKISLRVPAAYPVAPC